MTTISDIVHIPERVHQGDFVLKLTEGVGHTEEMANEFVVAPLLHSTLLFSVIDE